jgi:transcriptional regulator with XRE-family HTH domain
VAQPFGLNGGQMAQVDQEQLAVVIGRAIAKHRVASSFTQEQVAEALGIGNEAVSRMERGLVMPTVARLVDLANLFECNAADLLTEASSRTSDQAKHVTQLLAKLGGNDRTMVVEIVERLAGRLAKR